MCGASVLTRQQGAYDVPRKPWEVEAFVIFNQNVNFCKFCESKGTQEYTEQSKFSCEAGMRFLSPKQLASHPTRHSFPIQRSWILVLCIYFTLYVVI